MVLHSRELVVRRKSSSNTDVDADTDPDWSADENLDELEVVSVFTRSRRNITLYYGILFVT